MIRAAIVGLGWWGRVLVGAVQERSESIRFEAGTTRTFERGAGFAAEHGFRLLESFDDVLRTPEVDAVVLTTPDSQHAEQVIAAARAGKHVFVEKPFAQTLASAEAALHAVEAAGVTLGVGFQRRFHPAMDQVRGWVRAGEFGTVSLCEATMCAADVLVLSPEHWRADPIETPTGGLTVLGTHLVDSVIDLFGAIDEVYCQSLNRTGRLAIDDTTSVLLRTRSGIAASLSMGLASPFAYRFQVFGSGGWAAISELGMDRLEYVLAPEPDPLSPLPPPISPTARRFRPFDMVRAELEAFAVASEGGTPYRVTAHQILAGVSAVEAMTASARSGRAVRVV